MLSYHIMDILSIRLLDKYLKRFTKFFILFYKNII